MSSQKNSGRPSGDVCEEELYAFIRTHFQDDLMKILKDPQELVHFPIPITYLQLSSQCPKSSEELLRCPDKVLSSGDKAAFRALQDLYETCGNREELKLKRHVHVRIHCMPCTGIDRYTTVFPGCDEIGTFMTIVGTVVKIQRTGMVEFKRDYVCNKCKHITTQLAPIDRYYTLPRSLDQCENLCIGAKVDACDSGVDGITSKDASRFKDYQEIKLQEQIKNNDSSTMPSAMWVILEDDLVDSCKPGDDVVMTGTLFCRFKPFRVNQPIEADLAFKANHVEVRNDQRTSVLLGEKVIKFFKEFWTHYDNNPFEGRNMILRSFCPKVYGMYLVKLAMCVVLAGGVSKKEGGSHERGESHLLLVGDPGTGKSQLLKYASKLTPRSVFTTGTGTTTAGLTVAAVKENGTWNLEAGALVLADSGVCCIDEFSNIKEHDRVSIHEAMEQQTISTAKAGIVSKLSTKCTIIAATNPKFTKYDPNEDVELNVGLPSPLLSRFDLVIVLRDAQNEAWDELLCDFILGDTNVFEMAAKNAMAAGSIWDTETLRSYMVLIKEKEPAMTEEAETILSRYYHLQRNSDTRIAARTTVRLFEKGHAKLMYRECVLVHDAVIAISLVEASMQSSALTGNLPNPLHISFPQNPLEEYRIQAKKLLELLNLPELWLPEKIWLTSLTRVKRRPSNPPPPPGIIKSAVPKDNEGHTGGDSATLSRFFETGDDDEQTPCSLRIVTSTQKSNAPSKDAAQENYTEFLSPIAPSSARFRNVLRSPPTVDNSSTGDSDDSSPRQPKKRKRAATVFDESGIGSGDNELDRQIECMTPPPAEAVILKENVSDTNKPAGVSKFSSVLSRFRRDKD